VSTNKYHKIKITASKESSTIARYAINSQCRRVIIRYAKILIVQLIYLPKIARIASGASSDLVYKKR